jgi:hypothetical protein
MVYLILMFCFGSHCDERVVWPESFPSVAACSRQAQLAAAEWIDEHPGYELGAATCTTSRPAEEHPT